MSAIRPSMPLRFLWSLALLACIVARAMAQHTEVKSNGVNGRIEIDYNAAGKVSETRTVGPDGKVQQKVDYEYLPGYFGAQQTDTTYWPDSKIRRIARNTYDENSNFTGEFIQVFDESGKQISGHKLTHDPWTGIYRCNEWDPSTQNYKSMECPAGEESEGGVEQIKKFTYEEVMRHLDAARKAARQGQNAGQMTSADSVQPSARMANREIGLVLPAELHPGERVSGRVVENPEPYEGMPGVSVTRVAMPLEREGGAWVLGDWYIDIPGEAQQKAEEPVTFIVPSSGSLNLTFRQAGNPAYSVSKTLSARVDSGKKPSAQKSYKAAALCLSGELCVVSGPFSGDSRKTFAAFEDRPAIIVAETSKSAYISVPELTEPGARPLFIAEGSRVIALPVVVGSFFIKNNGRELQAGQNLIVFPTLEGPGDIPDSQWRVGNFPAANLEQARQLIPGFQLPKDTKEKRKRRGSKDQRESEEKKGGEILLVVKNQMPGQITLRASRNNMLVFHLTDESFSRGEFKFDLVVEAKESGKIRLKGYALPFLAPVTGQEFTGADSAAGK